MKKVSFILSLFAICFLASCSRTVIEEPIEENWNCDGELVTKRTMVDGSGRENFIQVATDCDGFLTVVKIGDTLYIPQYTNDGGQ